MKIDNIYVCNVCCTRSDEDKNAVFIKAHKGGEEVDICTSCMPSVIHGSGLVVKSNDEVREEISL
ncbi:hypothetical protein [Campylobacter geochelonis]|uniref:Uncharacterized protein n=1 Tax=Campylobacter geochelonis TaxID=1780362 RepID=A0A128EL94_9BACT|nr:hypothetical protein [Campylobacter geochelonis]QKF71961.1 hypothetical protein CGEO_1687 [Campylobacter geochelonis]CZE47797.1 Uncharacterised protein [Campylobacter geochelonis]CZE49013.1 Uncharacterised protein [Campylobacter geochelonis]CZE49959.1 Uncharacterised protein [Campylobacter geochelonis]